MELIKLLTWNQPSKITDRIYHKNSIKLPIDNICDIMLINNKQEYKPIGKATIVSNDKGLYVTNPQYTINKDILDKILDEYYQLNKDKIEKYTPELSFAGIGTSKEIYDEDDEVEFKFVIHTLMSNDNINEIIRELRLNSIIMID